MFNRLPIPYARETLNALTPYGRVALTPYGRVTSSTR